MEKNNAKKKNEKKLRHERIPRYGVILTLLAVTLLVAILVSCVLGRYPIAAGDVLKIIAGKVFNLEQSWTATQESLLLVSRLPRILMACLVGCALSAAGVSYQGVFQNPMAAPDILGASSGAAFGAALAILLHFGKTLTIVLAFTASLLTVSIVLFIGQRTKTKRMLGLILSGIMVSTLVSSGTSLIKLVADPEDQLPAITYWLMGSLNGTSPKDLQFVVIPMLLGLIPIFLLRWRINILTLGDDEAKTMGVNARRLRTAVIICATLVTAAAVSVSGVIGWVGLVIPHLSRRIIGNDFKKLVPVSMMMGALFLLIVDDLSRLLFATEIPIGILTSLVGAPFFIYLIMRNGEQL